MSRKIKCFDRELDRSRPHIFLDAGLRAVRVASITGTVNKCGELDRRFRNIRRKDRGERSRRYHLDREVHRYTMLAPIDVYRYRGEHYVIDGNRRVAAAISRGIEFIDARVTEVLSRDEPHEVRGALSRRDFEYRTGLRNLELAQESGYRSLIREIEELRGEDDLQERARSWYTDEFLPACRKIGAAGLPDIYRGLREGDLYVLVTDFYRQYMGGKPRGVDFDLLISGFLFAHRIRERASFASLLRGLVRLLAGLSGPGEGRPVPGRPGPGERSATGGGLKDRRS
ncbi:MAG: ParB N-terminal domain-containing protein [Spirochaetota bacterium]